MMGDPLWFVARSKPIRLLVISRHPAHVGSARAAVWYRTWPAFHGSSLDFASASVKDRRTL